MDPFVTEWLNLLARWGHMIAGIAWIGTSFYFVALDFSLRKPAGLPEGVSGEAWEVHGGGFYNVRKYLSAPAKLPEDLIWFKWEAYLTWVTGFLLLCLQYYVNAGSYLIDPAVLSLLPWQAVAISLGSLAAGWIVYDFLCRQFAVSHPQLLGRIGFRADHGSLLWLHPGLFRARGFHTYRHLHRHPDGGQCLRGHHSEPAEDHCGADPG